MKELKGKVECQQEWLLITMHEAALTAYDKLFTTSFTFLILVQPRIRVKNQKYCKHFSSEYMTRVNGICKTITI